MKVGINNNAQAFGSLGVSAKAKNQISYSLAWSTAECMNSGYTKNFCESIVAFVDKLAVLTKIKSEKNVLLKSFDIQEGKILYSVDGQDKVAKLVRSEQGVNNVIKTLKKALGVDSELVVSKPSTMALHANTKLLGLSA